MGDRPLNLSEWIHWLPVLVYAGLALHHARRWSDSGPVNERDGRALRVGGVLAHGVGVASTAFLQGRLPFGTMWEALMLATLVLACGYLLVEHLARSSALATPFFGIAALGCILSAANHEAPRWPIHVPSNLFAAHVSFGITGIALLVVSGLLAAAWIVQYRELRARRFGRISQRLPDLSSLDRLMWAFSVVGSVLLLAGAVVGILWLVSQGREFHSVLLKFSMVLTTLAWSFATHFSRWRRLVPAPVLAWMVVGGMVPVAIVVWAGAGGY